jgi:pterin-4a-carbinolamine dehydratase
VRPTDRAIADISDQTVSRDILSADELAREVQQLGKRWSLVGPGLVLEVQSREMQKLASVVAMAAAIADEMDHQPVISIDVPCLRLTIPNAATVHDLVFAARLEQWLRDLSW